MHDMCNKDRSCKHADPKTSLKIQAVYFNRTRRTITYIQEANNTVSLRMLLLIIGTNSTKNIMKKKYDTFCI